MNILKKNTFSLEPGRAETIFAKKMFLLHIFLCNFAYIPINKNTSILRKVKKAISKFKKRNNNIFYEKSKFYLSKLIFTIYNYIFILYLCYYLFFRLFLDPFGYSVRNKILV